MKVCQIVQSVSNMSAGPTYSVGSLADELTNLNCEAKVCSFSKHTDEWPFKVDLINSYEALESFGLLGLNSIKLIRELGRTQDVLHAHGVWRSANLFTYFLNENTKSKIVWSPRGMFSEWSWSQKSLMKKPFWYILQKRSVNKSVCIHATAKSEYEDVRNRGLIQPVAVIPNGVPIPSLDRIINKRKEIVFLSRIHKKKGIELLIDSWSELENKFPDWQVKVAGPLDSAYAIEIQNYAKQKKLVNFKFIGEVHGDSKRKLLSEASIFILPSYSENFGIAIAEALAHGTAVISTTETPWEKMVEHNCGWWVKPNKVEIKEAINNALTFNADELMKKGINGRVWMKKDYSWNTVAEQMLSVYMWQKELLDKPEFVVVD